MSSSKAAVTTAAVIISCDQPPQNIISLLVDGGTLPFATYSSNIKGYLYNKETIYYSAKVYLYTIEQKEKLDLKQCETIRAIYFFFKNIETTNLDDVQNWMPYLKHIEAQPHIVICNGSSEEAKGRESIFNWCVQNQFTLFELDEPVNMEEDDVTVREAKIFDRVLQRLESDLRDKLSLKA